MFDIDLPTMTERLRELAARTDNQKDRELLLQVADNYDDLMKERFKEAFGG